MAFVCGIPAQLQGKRNVCAEREDCSQLRRPEHRAWVCGCRAASVEATTKLKCFVLARDRFVEILGPLYSLMAREKSPAVVTQRLMKLQTKVSPLPASSFLVQAVTAVSLTLAHHCRHAWVNVSGMCIK